MLTHSFRTWMLALLAVALTAAGLLVAQPAAAATPTSVPTPVVTPTLTDDEAAAILFMREEEKMARDLYNAFADQWNWPIFSNIAVSEQRHFDSVGILITRYGLTDPAAGNAPGEFTDPALQALYDDLLAQGSTSLTAALQVGVTVEETDIADLDKRLATVTQFDVKRVFTMLRRGSVHHLAAFNAQLDQ